MSIIYDNISLQKCLDAEDTKLKVRWHDNTCKLVPKSVTRKVITMK
jgi:hypothetical protein